MTRQVSPNGVAFTKSFEGCRLVSYPDPGTGGAPWTCGYGHTGPDVKPGMTVTQAQADAWIVEDLGRAAQSVNALVHVALTQNQFDALADFVFNVGAGNLRSSTLLRKLNAGDYAGAANQFLLWDKAGGRPLKGLTKRRQAERKLFLS